MFPYREESCPLLLLFRRARGFWGDEDVTDTFLSLPLLEILCDTFPNV
jgi:hypothetical protein